MALRLDQSLPALEDRALVRVRRRAPGLTFDATLAPWWVVGEAAAMERATTNLLDNAAKWSPPELRAPRYDGPLTGGPRAPAGPSEP
ncbi:MAG TPA: hypothetical protein VES21_07845 [Nocardioidaceae bacterium]|nr:hypothetical protein [Nocardioidaceae bacterium]